jgi:hypothetical protein
MISTASSIVPPCSIKYCMRALAISLLALLLQGCTVAAGYLGATGTTLQVAQAVDVTKLAVDAVSTIETGKPIMDHVTSRVLDQDCNSFRLLRGEPMCVQPDRLRLRIIDSILNPAETLSSLSVDL